MSPSNQMTAKEIFQQFESSAQTGIDNGLDFLEKQFRDTEQLHRLFDVLKMKIRRELGLKLFHHRSDPPLEKVTQERLESRFLDACHELARLFFEQGNLREGWMYLQPIADQPRAKELLERVSISDGNYQSLIEIALNERVSPAFGYRVLLERCGTCDGITAFDMQAAQFETTTISELASVLLQHFYEELRGNIAAEVQRKEGPVDEQAGLDELLSGRDWLFTEGGLYVDATHLASVVRIARQTVTPDDRARALSLARYGTRIDKDLQYPGDPPFFETYRDHCIWFETLCGHNVAAGIEHFRKQAQSAKGRPEEIHVAEALVDLQIQAGFRDEAVSATVERILPHLDTNDLPAAAFEIAATAQQYDALAKGFQQHENFSAYAFSRLCQQEFKQASQEGHPNS